MKMFNYNVIAFGRCIGTICLQDRQAWDNKEVLNALVAWRYIEESEAENYLVFNSNKDFDVCIKGNTVLTLIEVGSFCPYLAHNID